VEQPLQFKEFPQNQLQKKRKKQMDDIKILREYVRKSLKETKKTQKKDFFKQKIEEYRLRKTIRKLIREAEDIVTHESTGINVLADLLETIVPILKSFYKKLGTDVQQRKSFRAHIIKSVQNLLSPISVMFKAGGTVGNPVTAQSKPTVAVAEPQQELAEQDEETVEGPEADPAFIPLKADKKEQEAAAEPKETKPEDAFVEIEGEDETGRNIALQSFKRVEKQIREAYSILANQEDRDLFYKFLITNLKLYFDKFEDELQSTVPEPTTPEYEQEKQSKEASLNTGSEAVPETGTTTPEEIAEPQPEETPA
jgi:hypothetical protein